MAQLSGMIEFTGRIGKVTAYRMKGSDRIILRSHGGPSKNKIKKSPKFAVTRKNNHEFGGRSTACKWILKMLYHQKPQADYNIAGPLNALLKPVQAMDTTSEFGKRNILLSQNPGLLAGFNLNRRHPFDTIVRQPLAYTLSRNDLAARIDIGPLLPGINFFVPGNYPLYSFIASVGAIPDLYYGKNGYQPSGSYSGTGSIAASTEWFPVIKGSPATSLELKCNTQFPNDFFTLLLTIGIRFGNPQGDNMVQPIKYAGSAKVLAVI